MRAQLVTSETYRGQFQFQTDDPYFAMNCTVADLITDDYHIVNRDRVVYICEEVAKTHDLTVSDNALELMRAVLTDKTPESGLWVRPFEGFEWKSYQKRAINCLEFEPNTMLQLSPGCGKAQPNDEPVLTPYGWRPIGDLLVGDVVYDGHGNDTVVDGVFHRGMLEEYRVEFADGRYALCAGDHLWKVSSSIIGGDRSWKVFTTEELIQKGIRRKCDGKAKFCVPLSGAIDKPYKKLPVDPYVLGVLIGDGALTQPACIFSTSEQDIADRLQERLGSDYWVHKYVSNNYSWGIAYKPEKTMNLLKRAIKKLHLDKHSGQKFIPKIYKDASASQRRDLLAGLFDTDGHVSSNGTFSFSTTSKRLANDIVELCFSLGYQAHIQAVDKRPGRNACYSVWIGTNDRIFYSNKHNERFDKSIAYKTGHFHRYDSVKITSIEKTGRVVEMTCISVESADHTYITRDYIVTHNTLVATMMACQRYERGDCGKIVVFCPSALIFDWMRELNRSTKLTVATCKKSWSAKKREEFYLTDDSDVWVMNYERMRTVDREPIEKALKKKKPLFVLDEVQAVRGRTSTMHKELAKLSRHCKATHIALTATPVVVGPENFYNEFRIIDPKVFGTVRDFEHMFTYNDGERGFWGEYIGYKNLAYMHVMTGAQVFSASKSQPEIAKEFPDKQEILYEYELYPKIRSVYDEIFQYGKSIRDGRQGALFMMTFMRLCNMPMVALLEGDYDPDTIYGQQAMAILEICKKHQKELSDLKNCAKLELAEDKVQEIIESGEKVLVFAQYTNNCLYPLGERLKRFKPLFYTGDVDAVTKERVKDEFKHNDERKLLLMSDAGQVGLNFQECRYLIHYQTPTSHASYEQRSDRISRVDSKFDSITVMRFVGKNTVEERVEETMLGRMQMASEMGFGEFEEAGTISPADADWLAGF